VPHISSYALTVEPKTALQKMIELKKKENINNDAQAIQYSMLMKALQVACYEHYEISNFA
jgi:oxygen-independent coproporphyrinogen-3 oxidase